LLNNLKENDEQEIGEPCISPPELSLLHKVQGVLFAVADPTAGVVKVGLISSYNAGSYIADGVHNAGLAVGNGIHDTSLKINNMVSGLLANAIGSLPDAGVIAAVPFGVLDSENIEAGAEELPPPASSVEKETVLPQEIPEIKDEVTIPTEPEPILVEPVPEKEEVVDVVPEKIDPIVSNTTYYGGGGGSSTPTDIVAPVITILGNNPETITKDSIYLDAGATALDDVDGVIEVVVTGVVDISVVGVYIITYTATDLSNNIATMIRTINVVLPPPPPLATFTIDSDTTLVAGEYNYDNLIITNNAVLTLDSNRDSLDPFKGVKINAVNITIENGSSISAQSKGYANGPGTYAENSPGASYGGTGDKNISTSIYGSATKPIDLGSGGYNYFRDGGAIRLVVTDTLINNGIVSSNGDSTSSGGSIYVTTKNLTGSGSFSANGGGLYSTSVIHGSGSGGRIAIYYEVNSFSGIVEAKGGCGSYDGYSRTCAMDGTVGYFDTINNDLSVYNSWQFLKVDSPFNYNKIILTNGSTIRSEKEVNITADDLLLDKISNFTLNEDQIINISSIRLNENSRLTLSGSEMITADNLIISGNSDVTIVIEKIFSLTIPNINIESGSSISADTKGYFGGPGAPLVYRAGASYGGAGEGSDDALTYGSVLEPVDFGSGGNGDLRGGGAIRLVVTDTFINNGIVSSNGNSTSSGGSIYITVKNLSGSGKFSANGGGLYSSSVIFGSGGGGRNAIYYESNLFTGTVEAKGGCGSYDGYSRVCAKDGTVKMIDTTKSSVKQITTFDFMSLTPNVVGMIDEVNHAVSLTVPFGTAVTALVSTITISEKAIISPDTNVAQDFTNAVTYTVTAENGSTQDYIVTVLVASDPNPLPDDTIPSILSSSLNGIASDVATNPVVDLVSIAFIANENVDWVSIKIEKEDDETVYKYFYPGIDCDGQDACTKSWNGLLAGDSIAPIGVYKIRVRIRDLISLEEYDFSHLYKITVDTSL